MKLPDRFLAEVTPKPDDSLSPRSILATLGELIGEQTDHHVMGVVEYRKTTFDGLVFGDGIQQFIYDFVLSAPILSYRYYLFHIQYPANPSSYYPLKLTIDMDIAQQLNCSTEITCKQAEDFEAQLERIMAADKTIAVVRSLYQHSQSEPSGSPSILQDE
jgi:hypothetical protein